MLHTILYSSFAGMVTCLGTVLVMNYHERLKDYMVYFVSFAVGGLLGASFFEIIPEAMELIAERALTVVLIGFLIFYLLENVFIIHSCAEAECDLHTLGWMSLFGLFFHSFVDGVAIAAGFEVDQSLGVIAALAVIFHEFPEGMITTSLLLKANFERRPTMIYSIFVGLATPLGAILTGLFAQELSGKVVGIMLALAAGSFLYVASADLIPITHHEHKKLNMVAVLLGVAIVFGVHTFLK
jgi:zinc transporter ZupT